MNYDVGLGATRLTVLREVDMKYASAGNAARAYAAAYGIPFITQSPQYLNLYLK